MAAAYANEETYEYRGKTYKIKRYTGQLLQGPRCVIPKKSSLYPAQLWDLDNPPEELYVIGDPDCLQLGGLAIVGARKATPYGLSCAQRFGQLAAQRGVVIVSGGARGCDSAAHKASLSVAGKTVVVLGGGCDEIYPAANAGLFQQVIDAGGAVISENPWSMPALPYSFRLRNRIIAALSRATLIVEAGLPSGTFSTADEALHMGREVLVIPGAITSPTSLGANRLLYQGALPVVDDESFIDILSSVFSFEVRSAEAGQPFMSVNPAAGADTTELLFEDPLIAALRAQAMNPEDIYKLAESLCGADNPHAWASIRIEDAQNAGLITRYPDGTYGALV